MHDIAIIGAGIVGLSTARQLQIRHPDKKILLLEKEVGVARHQSGRNSGVIHAGIYYAPGSLKARFCKEGAAATIAFCKHHEIPYEQCGKLIVASDEAEYERLLDLFERARLSELDVELVDGAELKHIEPEITGIAAIRLKTSGIVNYTQIAEKLAEEFRSAGGEIQFGLAVTHLTETPSRIDIEMETGKTLQSRFLIVCGGLMADRLTRMLDMKVDFRIIPYRGEYYQLPPERNDIVKHLIYPVPDPALPFLGVHLTRMIDGSVTIGPSALQGWKREGYGILNFNVQDIWEQLTFAGYWKISYRFFWTGIKEVRNALWKPSYLKSVHKYCPSIRRDELLPYPVGVRAMAVRSDGTMIDDFLFAETDRSLHVCNAPSPAATSAFPIGNYICDKFDAKLGGD